MIGRIRGIRPQKLAKMLAIILSFVVAASAGGYELLKEDVNETQLVYQSLIEEARQAQAYQKIEDIPKFSGDASVSVNGNVPYFDEMDMTLDSYQLFTDLDSLGRCGEAMACIGKESMPTEPRGEIGMIKPSGWQIAKYDFVDGKYLYNRCHLIGYQLTGENANEKNLITGTRFLNIEGMLPFENKVAEYLEESGNHVIYRVTPIFEGDNLLASGVLIEAKSVEDDGSGICFCKYCYNAEPGVEIDHSNGDNRLSENFEN